MASANRGAGLRSPLQPKDLTQTRLYALLYPGSVIPVQHSPSISAPLQLAAQAGLVDSRFQLTASPIRYASAATKAPKETSS